MMRSKKNLASMIILLICAIIIGCANAEIEIDVYQYSYEELLEIRQLVDGRIEEMDRQYALEHADRKIVFEEPEQIVYLGREAQVLPTVERITEDAPSNTEFVWASSDPAVATVNNRGTVRAVSAGDAVITASAKDNEYLSASYLLHSAVAVEQVTVWGPTEPLYLGNQPEDAIATMGFSVEPEDAHCQTVVWTSSDETVATVDENGQVRGQAPGTAVITATSAENPRASRDARAATFTVSVIQRVTDLRLSETEIALVIGQTGTLSAATEPANAKNRQVVYSSSDPEIATVDERGVIRPVEAGECVITCKTTDGSELTAFCYVTVSRPVTGLEIPETELNLGLGDTHTVDVTVMPENASNRDLLWTSSNVFVARVAEGTIEAVGQGECVIMCTTKDGSNLSAMIRVRVPTFSVQGREYTVTEKTGLTIPVKLNAEGVQLTVNGDMSCFTALLDWQQQIHILPITAGEGVITVENPDAPEDTVSIRIRIENSAVFNQESYPAIPYMELARVPELYEGAQISIYGKILHISEEEEGKRTFMVGTAGDAYTDQVIFVRSDTEMIPEGLESREMVTVYGLFRVDYSYSEILQAKTMVPALEAEKIVVETMEEQTV